jgi:tetratricopeptide (TPR) repeat protein
MNVTMLRSFVAISFLALATAASAQDVDESALDALDKANANTVPAIREPAGAVELRAAMRRISYNSSDADALADAGNASLILGDANAALNFFTRANTARPNNSRIVAGLAAATVQTENPFEALRLFDDAIRLGVNERSIAADRALAFDLLGNFSRAQQDYKLARSASTSDDLVIRQAISLSLGGQKAEADAMLIPLLQKNSAAAWRARAFMLAARGEFRESTKVTEGFMDAASAQRMERYLRLMPDLTGAQQAAAIHLGHFPASQYVGRDSDQVRRVASTIPPVEPGPGERRLIPAGDPLGPKNSAAVPAKNVKKTDSKRDKKAKEQEEIKTAVANIQDSIKLPKTDRSRLGTETARAKVEEAQSSKISAVGGKDMPPPESARPLVKVALPQADQPLPPTATTATLPSSQSILNQSNPPVSDIGFSTQVTVLPPVTTPSTPSPTVIASSAAQITAEPTVTASPAVTVVTQNIPVQGPTLDGAPIAPSVAPPSITEPAAVPAAAAPAFDLAAIVGSIQIPESEQKPSAVPVDLKKIKPTLPKTAAVDPAAKNAKLDPKAVVKAKEPPHPARFWVQIATGEANALGFDYRKWSKKSPDLFKAQSGWTSAWGKTSRLLVGPFPDMKVAKKWEGDFRKAGGNGFMWKSENGVAVTALKGK